MLPLQIQTRHLAPRREILNPARRHLPATLTQECPLDSRRWKSLLLKSLAPPYSYVPFKATSGSTKRVRQPSPPPPVVPSNPPRLEPTLGVDVPADLSLSTLLQTCHEVLQASECGGLSAPPTSSVPAIDSAPLRVALEEKTDHSPTPRTDASYARRLLVQQLKFTRTEQLMAGLQATYNMLEREMPPC